MDGGKAICLTVNNDYDLWDFEWEKTPPTINNDNQFPILVTIPTTAVNGAETESTAMVTDTKEGVNGAYAILVKTIDCDLDPELTLGLPSNLTAWTGIDAMVHSVEGYCVPDHIHCVMVQRLKVSTYL